MSKINIEAEREQIKRRRKDEHEHPGIYCDAVWGVENSLLSACQEVEALESALAAAEERAETAEAEVRGLREHVRKFVLLSSWLSRAYWEAYDKMILGEFGEQAQMKFPIIQRTFNHIHLRRLAEQFEELGGVSMREFKYDEEARTALASCAQTTENGELVKWLESVEGREAVHKAIRQGEEACRQLREAREIPDSVWRRQFVALRAAEKEETDV